MSDALHIGMQPDKVTPMANARADVEESAIHVVIIDDHDLFRSGLTAMLRAEPRIEVVGQASRGTMGVRLAVELQPDVVLMDLCMPDMDGIAATRLILKESPATRIIVLTIASDALTVESALRAGVCGYVLKDGPITDTIAAVRAVAHGESWLSPRAASAALQNIRGRPGVTSGPEDPYAVLSPREIEILRLLAHGMENSEIASELSISPQTAKNHISSVLTKLGMTNRVKAATYAIRHGVE